MITDWLMLAYLEAETAHQIRAIITTAITTHQYHAIDKN